MKQTHFLTTADALYINERQIAEFGGLYGIRDMKLLESAINTPQASFDGSLLHEDIPAQAAAYLFHVVKNHPFLDGNKRTGVVCATSFLDTNHIKVPWSNDELFDLAIQVATSQMSKDKLIEEFRRKLSRYKNQ
jgi:death on curing protein